MTGQPSLGAQNASAQIALVEDERDSFWCPRDCKRHCGPGTCACAPCFCTDCRRRSVIASSGRIYVQPDEDAHAPQAAYQPRLFTTGPRSLA